MRPPVPIRLVDTPGAEPLNGHLMDVSASGVGVRLDRPLAPGREFTMALPKPDDVKTPLRYRVARCRPLVGGEFHVGASFVRTAPPHSTNERP